MTPGRRGCPDHVDAITTVALVSRRAVALVTAVVVSAIGTAAIAAPGIGSAVVGETAERVEPPMPRATFSFTGDTLTLRRVNYSALQPDGTYDYHHMFAGLAPYLRWADVAICHFENPVAPPGQPVIVEPPAMSASWELAPALAAAGFDRCSTASNHSMDRGAAGIDATLNALDGAGITHHGMARSARERVAVPFDVNGISVAHLSYSFNFDGHALPAGQPWRANRIDPAVIIADATQARADGADAVIVSLHWGATGAVQPTADQRTIAQQITAPGVIDLIVGHHAHVLQPITQVNGIWVAWGLGNLLSDHPTGPKLPPASQDGAIVSFEITKAPDGSIAVHRPTAVPTWVDKANRHTIRTTYERFDTSLPAGTRAQLEISHARTATLLAGFVP